MLQAQVALTRVFFRPFVRGLGVREDWMVALMVRVPEKLGLPVRAPSKQPAGPHAQA